MNNLLILGGTGCLGKNLTLKLSELNISFKLLIHNTNTNTKNNISGDILTKGLLDSQLSENTVVLNMIGQYTGNSKNFIEQNIIGGKNLLESCVKNKIKRIILISTINVYGNCESAECFTENDDTNPKTFYGLIKSLTEQLYQYYSNLYNLNITIIRLSNLYGPDQKTGLISNLFNSDHTPCIISHNGNQTRDFLYVDDAIDGICNIIKKNSKGFEIFNISGGKSYSVKEVIQILKKINIKKLNFSFNSDQNDECYLCANNSKAKKQFGFSPLSLENGLKKLCDSNSD
jgi:UDP-glucose 4-epimerase